MAPGPGRSDVARTLHSHGWSMRDIGAMLGISAERVRQVLAQGTPKAIGRPRRV